jgi:hypothetical protein
MSLPPAGTYGIQTNNRHYLTAANGGGLEGINWAAFSTNATRIGALETLTWIWVDQGQGAFALQTARGNFVTAVNAGGVGGPNNESAPLHTDATWYRAWEHFDIVHVNESQQTIGLRTITFNYLTAINGGGIGGPNESPSSLHTDAGQVRDWEIFF